MKFVCFKEVAHVNIPAYILAEPLKQHYASVNTFQIHSEAKIVVPEDITLNSPTVFKVSTNLQAKEPFRPPPGQGNDKNEQY